jgi:hypothetical protein
MITKIDQERRHSMNAAPTRPSNKRQRQGAQEDPKEKPSLQHFQFCRVGSSGSLMPTLLSVENRVPLKPVLGGVRDVALNQYLSCTDSIKPSLQFSCNFVVMNASGGSLCFQIFGLSLRILYLSILFLISKSLF